MGTSHTERDSVEADKIRLKPNNNSQNSNKENHQNQGMTKIIIIIIMGGEGRGTQTHTNAPLQRSANHTLKYCQAARVKSRSLTVAKGYTLATRAAECTHCGRV